VCNCFCSYTAEFDETPDEMQTRLASFSIEYDKSASITSSNVGFKANPGSASNVQSDTPQDMSTTDSLTEDTLKSLRSEEEWRKKKEERKNSMRIAMLRMKEAQVVSTYIILSNPNQPSCKKIVWP